MARNRPNNAANGEVDLGEAQIKKHRPKDTKLRQQKLPAWQPIFNAKTVIPIFFTISVLFIPIGIVLLITSNGVKEWSHYYDVECEKQMKPGGNQTCKIDIQLDEDFLGDVYFYYGLEKYYQNHRRYMRSRNDLQMLGRLDQVAECAPYDKNNPDSGSKIAPCGAIANSMFNDTFQLFDSNQMRIEWSYEELIWPIDREKFRNPKCTYGDCKNSNDLCGAFKDYEKPPNWQKEPCQLDLDNVENSGLQNADFIIWMRTAALPDFRKPYRKLKDPNGLRKGHYELRIENNYNISSFSGRKSFIISTTSWLGGKNPFLGFAYIGVGILCALVGALFIVIHLKYGHTLHEMAGIDQQTRNQQQNGGRHSHNQ